MTTPEALMRAYYSARAPEYDSIYLRPERQADLRAVESWLAPRFAAEPVLEIACGTGYWTSFIASSAARIVALDSAPETLHIARGRISATTVQFMVGDAYALPENLGEFDAAFAGFWFSHVPKARRTEFLRGVTRVLRPGAKVVLLDNLYVEGSSSPATGQDAGGDSWQTRQLADGSSHRVIKNFPDEAELRQSIAGVGDQGIYTHWTCYWAFEFRVGPRAFEMSGA